MTRTTRIRFRLRTLLAAFFVVSAVLAWTKSRSFQQYSAIRHIEALGGKVTYEYELTGKPSPGIPRMFGNVESIQLGGWYISPSGDQIDVIRTSVTDQDLMEIVAALPDLRRLHLDDTLVTDDSIEALKSLRQVEYIGLAGTRITAAGRKVLQSHLPNCEFESAAVEVNEGYRGPFGSYYLDLIAE